MLGETRNLLSGISRMFLGTAASVDPTTGLVIAGDALPGDNVDFGGAWGGAWRYVGFTEGGVKATFAQTFNAIRSDQQYSPVLQIRTATEETIATTLTENTLQNIKDLLGRGTLTSVAAGTLIAAPTTAPALTTASAGGTIPAGTYQGAYSYVTASGLETTPSPSGSVTTTGTTSTISFPTLTLPAGVASVNYYVSQAGGTALTLQGNNTGAAFTLTAPPTSTGKAPPTTNSTNRGHTDLTIDSGSGVRYVAVGFEGHAPPNDKGLPRRILFPRVISTGPAEAGQALGDVTKLAATFARVGGDEGNPVIRDVINSAT